MLLLSRFVYFFISTNIYTCFIPIGIKHVYPNVLEFLRIKNNERARVLPRTPLFRQQTSVSVNELVPVHRRAGRHVVHERTGIRRAGPTIVVLDRLRPNVGDDVIEVALVH